MEKNTDLQWGVSILLMVMIIFFAGIGALVGHLKGYSQGYVDGKVSTIESLDKVECGTRAQERGLSHHYIESTPGGNVCWGETRHPQTQNLFRVRMNPNNREDSLYQLDEFLNGKYHVHP